MGRSSHSFAFRQCESICFQKYTKIKERFSCTSSVGLFYFPFHSKCVISSLFNQFSDYLSSVRLRKLELFEDTYLNISAMQVHSSDGRQIVFYTSAPGVVYFMQHLFDGIVYVLQLLIVYNMASCVALSHFTIKKSKTSLSTRTLHSCHVKTHFFNLPK